MKTRKVKVDTLKLRNALRKEGRDLEAQKIAGFVRAFANQKEDGVWTLPSEQVVEGHVCTNERERLMNNWNGALARAFLPVEKTFFEKEEAAIAADEAADVENGMPEEEAAEISSFARRVLGLPDPHEECDHPDFCVLDD